MLALETNVSVIPITISETQVPIAEMRWRAPPPAIRGVGRASDLRQRGPCLDRYACYIRSEETALGVMARSATDLSVVAVFEGIPIEIMDEARV